MGERFDKGHGVYGGSDNPLGLRDDAIEVAPAIKGKRGVPIPKPCGACDGSGEDRSDNRYPCEPCRGKGYL